MRPGLALRLAFPVVLLCGTGLRLAAQGVPARQGFWFGVNGGYGRVSLPNCISCESEGAPVGSLRLGMTLHQNVLAGLELTRTMTSGATGLPAVSMAAATAYVYPIRRSGLHVKLGAGLAAREAYSNVDGIGAVGFVGGIGYDQRVARNLSVVPYVSWLGMLGAYETHVVQAGLGITLH